MEKTTAAKIKEKCDALCKLLTAKNKAYGDSATNPQGIFAKGKASDLIRCRIDDKLNRIMNAPDAFGEDVVSDLLGYLILLQIAQDDEN